MDTLFAGQSLYPGNSLVSANKIFRLTLNLNGDLVLYGNAYGRDVVMWSSNTANKGFNMVTMKSNGQLIIKGYQGNGLVIGGDDGWSDPYLIVQDDGNLVIYGKKHIWATGTNTNRYLYMY